MEAVIDIPALPSSVLNILRVKPQQASPAGAVAWSPGPRGLLVHIPKAASARASKPIAAEHVMCQEKLNGVFAFYDGRDLWTKSGVHIDAPHFTQWLPPGFALVGERPPPSLARKVANGRGRRLLYLGNGHFPRTFAATIAGNKLPALDKLPEGTREATRKFVWRHARLVAFDVPNLDASWTYAKRYALLQLVVGAWSRKLPAGRDAPSVLPLQLIRQHPFADVAAFFREVVEGNTPWTSRAFKAFGIPEVDERNGLYVAHPTRWREEGATAMMAAMMTPGGGVGAGEGLMIYDQRQPWRARGASGRPTDAILKYKPTVLTTGTVIAPPYVRSSWASTSGGNNDDDDGNNHDAGDDDEYRGFHVRLRHWDAVAGAWCVVKPFVSSVVDTGRLLRTFQSDRRVFFTFVFYDAKPMYLHAIGPTLSHWDALAVQRTARPGASLDRLREAQHWVDGDVAGLFPSDFAWSPEAFCRAATRWSQIAASPLIAPDTEFTGTFGSIVRHIRQAAREAREREAAQVERRRREVEARNRKWLEPRTLFLSRFLVCMACVVHAWTRRTDRSLDWWARRGGAAVMDRPPTQWGPFVLRRPSTGTGALGPDALAAAWLYGLHRALLTVIASVWLRIGYVFREAEAAGVSTAENDNAPVVFGRGILRDPRALERMEAMVRSMVETELQPRWDAAGVRELVNPPSFKTELFGPLDMKQLNLAAAAHFVLQTVLAKTKKDAAGAASPAGAFGVDPTTGMMPFEAMWGTQGEEDQYTIDVTRHHAWLRSRLNPDATVAYTGIRDFHIKGVQWAGNLDAVPLERGVGIPVSTAVVAAVAQNERRAPPPPTAWTTGRNAVNSLMDQWT